MLPGQDRAAALDRDERGGRAHGELRGVRPGGRHLRRDAASRAARTWPARHPAGSRRSARSSGGRPRAPVTRWPAGASRPGPASRDAAPWRSPGRGYEVTVEPDQGGTAGVDGHHPEQLSGQVGPPGSAAGWAAGIGGGSGLGGRAWHGGARTPSRRCLARPGQRHRTCPPDPSRLPTAKMPSSRYPPAAGRARSSGGPGSPPPRAIPQRRFCPRQSGSSHSSRSGPPAALTALAALVMLGARVVARQPPARISMIRPAAAVSMPAAASALSAGRPAGGRPCRKSPRRPADPGDRPVPGRWRRCPSPPGRAHRRRSAWPDPASQLPWSRDNGASGFPPPPA